MENKSSQALSIAVEYFNAWTGKNYEKAGSLLSDNILFEMPINSYNNKNEFMQAVQFTASATSNINLLAKFGNDNEVILLYEFTLSSIGNLKIAEHFKVEKNKIVFIRHVHDTYELRKSGFDRGSSK